MMLRLVLFVWLCPLIAAKKGYKWKIFIPFGLFFAIPTFIVTIILSPKVIGGRHVPSGVFKIIHESVETRKDNHRCIYCGEPLETRICKFCKVEN